MLCSICIIIFKNKHQTSPARGIIIYTEIQIKKANLQIKKANFFRTIFFKNLYRSIVYINGYINVRIVLSMRCRHTDRILKQSFGFCTNCLQYALTSLG